jgi:hypothetical protein
MDPLQALERIMQNWDPLCSAIQAMYVSNMANASARAAELEKAVKIFESTFNADLLVINQGLQQLAEMQTGEDHCRQCKDNWNKTR